MLEGDIGSGGIHDLSGGTRHGLTIIRMHEGEQSAVRLMPRDRRHAQEFVDLGRPEHAIGFNVPVPDADLL